MSTNFLGRTWKRSLVLMGTIVIILILGMKSLSLFSPRPTNLGVMGGCLADCPATPNCVSTQTDLPSNHLPAVSFSGTSQETLRKIKAVIARSFPRAKLVSEGQRYLHYEFTSFLFRFVDDVEFLVDDESQQIHFRSASRVGHSDLGVNRNRMTQFVEEFNR